MKDFLTVLFKTLLAVILFPLLFIGVKSFFKHLSIYPNVWTEGLLWGGGAFILVFLFLDQCWELYDLEVKTTNAMLDFLGAVGDFIAKSIPLYSIIIILVFWLLKFFLPVTRYSFAFFFTAGALLGMHTILTAQDLQEKEKSLFKPGYFSCFSIQMLIQVIFIIMVLDLVLGKWTTFIWLKSFWGASVKMYIVLFRKLFFWL